MSKTLIACLTFDVDAMYGLVARGLTTPTQVSRGEFGAVAVPRILSTLKQHNITATFFIPGVVTETYPALCRLIADAGHEIANHGWSHTPIGELSVEEEEEELLKGSEAIFALTKEYPLGYRSPSWDLSAVTVDLLIKHGFMYESSLMGDDYTPYRARHGDLVRQRQPVVFGQPTPLIEMPISWSLDDFPHFEFIRLPNSVMPGLMNARSVLENWLDDFEYMRRTCDWGILTYTCHPYVIGRGHRMLMLEGLIEGLSDKGATFMPMREAARLYDTRNPFHEAAS